MPARNHDVHCVITSHVYPPIPVRTSDWCAYYDDLGADCSPYGWGRTEAEAIADLLVNTEDEPAPDQPNPDLLADDRDERNGTRHGMRIR